MTEQVTAINRLADMGMRFFDYGNSFLLESSRAGADVCVASSSKELKFRYPSYVEDIMGDIFSLGFGTNSSVHDKHRNLSICLQNRAV